MKDIIIEHIRQEFRIRIFRAISDPEKNDFYNRLQWNRYHSIDENTELIESGICDSFELVILRAWLERQFNVDIPDEKATVGTFSTVSNIVELIEELKK